MITTIQLQSHVDFHTCVNLNVDTLCVNTMGSTMTTSGHVSISSHVALIQKDVEKSKVRCTDFQHVEIM